MTRTAILVSHPIQHFSPWFREAAKDSNLLVLYGSSQGAERYYDSDFSTEFQWDLPLIEGYQSVFMSRRRSRDGTGFWDIDNPDVPKHLDNYAPDVVVLFGYSQRTMWRARSWAIRKQVPILIVSDSAIKNQPLGMRRRMKDLIVRRFYESVSGALAIGDQNRAYHEYYGVPSQRIFEGVLPVDIEYLRGTTPNVTEVRDSIRRLHGIPQDAFVVSFFGKLIDRKCPVDLASSVSLALDKGASRCWLLFVGDGPRRNAVEQAAPLRSTFAGFVNQAAIGGYYACSDVLTVPSSYDPHPLVVTEASAFGLPVVVSSRVGCTGPGDTARPGVNCRVFPVGDRSALADVILSLHESPTEMAKLHEGALQVASSQSMSRAASLLKNAIEETARLGPR
jgi:glycosyltransferase involved in cell wall biosynthesis